MEHDRKPPDLESALIPADQDLYTYTLPDEPGIPIEEGDLAGDLLSYVMLANMPRAAVNLHKRGMNVFPLPPIWELRNYAAKHQTELTKKPYTFIGEIYKSKLHLCDSNGEIRIDGRLRFSNLFYRANMGVTLGRLSENLFAVDCDSPTALKTVRAKLEQAGIKAWGFTGYKGGTFLMRLAEGEAANIPARKSRIPDVEIWGNRHFVILPPSWHIAGVEYKWFTPDPEKLPPGEKPPLVTLDQVADLLGVELHQPRKPKRNDIKLFGLPECTAVLSENNRDLLANGTIKGTRNNRFWAAACDLVANEETIPLDLGLNLLLAAGPKCDPEYPQKEILNRWEDALRKEPGRAQEYYGNNRTQRNTAHQKALAFAQSHRWEGHTAQTDRAVFLACCERSRVEGDLFRATTREIAEIANCSRKTAGEALKRLRQPDPNEKPKRTKTFKTPIVLKLVKSYWVETPTGKQFINNFSGNIYRFTLPEKEEEGGSSLTPIIVTCSSSGVTNDPLKHTNLPLPETPAEQDLSASLGPIAWRVWRLLLVNPMPSKRKIAAVANLNRSSVYGALKRLTNCKLVQYNQAEGVFYGQQKTEEELQRLVISLDKDRKREVSGRSSRRKETHELERARRLHEIIARERQNWHELYGPKGGANE